MRPSPKVSVLIPTYNYARYLPEAIDSVLTQNFTDFELVICDDHSSDNTAEVLTRYGARDPRILAEVHATNLGMVNNWNHCLQRARGEYVKFLFADDKLAEPSALGKLVKLLEVNPKATLAAGARRVLDENSRTVDVWETFAEGRHDGREVMVQCLMAHANLIGEPSATLFRKRDAERGFSAAYRQIVDLDFWFHLLEKGDLVYTREPLCGFRQHALQQTARNDSEGMAWGEHLLFASRHAAKSWMPRRALFPIAYEFRRSRRKQNMRTPVLVAAENEVAARLGSGWYWIYWARHRLTRPWENLAHSAGKRLRQRRLPS